MDTNSNLIIIISKNSKNTNSFKNNFQAKTPPEFIEKAKGIVCQHHELQRNKVSVENEVRQLEMEQEKIIQTKEKEMLEHLLKQGRHSGKLGVNYLAKNTIKEIWGFWRNFVWKPRV